MHYLFMLALLSGTQALAAKDYSKLPKSFCEPVTRIASAVEDCEGNDLFLQKGEDCLDLLDKESKTVAGILPAAFSKDLTQKQGAKFDSSGKDYKVTSLSLAYLIAVTNTAIAEIKSYQENLVLPPDSDEEEVTGGNVQAYAMSVDCYGANKENLDSLLEDFDKRLKQLQGAKAIADAHDSTSGSREQKVQMNSGTDIIRGQGKAAVLPKGGIPENRDSDVSGIKESKEKKK
ncbi:MAG: hypothetical protein AB7K68_11085 [Bacteriovoracia bacterium]